jgi:Malectin-like domain
MGQIVIGSEFRGGQNPFSGGHNLISRLKGTVFQNLGAGPCNTVDPPLTMTVVFFGISNKLIRICSKLCFCCRYPDDPYDRIWSWYQYDTTVLTNINTTAKIFPTSYFEPPNSVLQTALAPISAPNLTTVSFDSLSNYADFPGYYFVLYLVELQNLSGNQSRQYNIYINDLLLRAVTPLNLTENTIYSTRPFQYNHSVIELVQLSNSTLPPILNGMEVYWPMIMELDSLTSANDGKKSFLLTHVQ